MSVALLQWTQWQQYPEFQHILHLWQTPLLWIYLFIFKHLTFSSHKNNCFEYPASKRFSAFFFAACFSSGELELLTQTDKSHELQKLCAINNMELNRQLYGNGFFKKCINNFSTFYLFIYGRDKTFSALFLQENAETTQLRAFLYIFLHNFFLL